MGKNTGLILAGLAIGGLYLLTRNQEQAAPVGGEGGGGGGDVTNVPNTIPNILYALGFGAKAIGTAGIMVAGTYLGTKVLSPVAPVLGRSIAGVTPALFNAGRTALGASAGAGRLALGASASYLGADLASLGLAGTLGIVPLAAGAGYVGYRTGGQIMKSSFGKATLNVSGRMGEKIGSGSNPIQKVLFPHASVNVSRTDKAFAKIGLNTAQAQEILKRGGTYSDLVRAGASFR